MKILSFALASALLVAPTFGNRIIFEEMSSYSSTPGYYFSEHSYNIPPISKSEWFEYVYPESTGSQIYHSEYRGNYKYEGYLMKLEFHHYDYNTNTQYYRYGAWLIGYDPRQIQPNSFANLK